MINNKNTYGLDPEDLKTSISRLAHFSPSSVDESGNQVIDYLILDSLASLGLLFEATPKDIKEKIKKNVLLDFEEGEIAEASKRLARKNLVTVDQLDKWGIALKIKIKPAVEHEINVKRNEAKALEESVLTNWKKYLLEKYAQDGSVSENIEKIVLSLQLFISKIFIKHGLDSIVILYPDSKKAQKWTDSVDKSLNESLPKINDFIDSVLTIEIAEFIRNDDPERKSYLTNLFNSSYYWHLIQVDEKCSNILKSVTREQKLVLDNNILYNLVGIHGETLLESSHKLLAFAKELGYDLLVTTKTIDEFQNSLKWQMKEYKTRPAISANLAKIASDKLGAENFVTVYWKNLAERRITIEEFVSETSHIDNILQGLDISVTHKFRDDIEGSEELIEEMSLLKQACGDHFNEHIIEHDAFHRIFIRRLRKGNKYNFKEAKAWFLTQDTKLPHYSRFARKGEAYLPFCITTNQWIQLNRPFLSRTKNTVEYETSMYNLITQPFLRSLLPRHPLEDAYRKVFGRLSRYENSSPELASEMAADTHFMFSIAGFEEGEKSQEEIDQKVDNKITEANKKLRKKLEALAQENKSSERRVNSLEQKVTVLSEKVLVSEQEFKRKESSFKESEENQIRGYKTLNESISAHVTENEKLRNKLELLLETQVTELVSNDLKSWKKYGVYSFITALVIVGIAVMEVLPTWELNYPGKFLDWIDGIQSESRREFFRWINISLIGGLIVPLMIFSYNRVFNKAKALEKCLQLTDHHKKNILKSIKAS